MIGEIFFEWCCQVVVEVKSWIGMFWYYMVYVKGVGVDCVQFFKVVYVGFGLVEDFYMLYYLVDWYLYCDLLCFLWIVLGYVELVQVLQFGDIVMFIYGCYVVYGVIVIVVDCVQLVIVYVWCDEGMVVVIDLNVCFLFNCFSGYYSLKRVD